MSRHNVVLRDKSRNITVPFSSGEDLSKRKRAEKALSQSEQKFRRYLDNSPDSIVITDTTGRLLYVNSASERISGYSKEELVGKSFLELPIFPKDALAGAEQLLESSTGKTVGPDNFELIGKDKNRRSIEISSYATGEGGEREVIIISRDITERSRMEKALRESDERFRRLVEHALDIIFRWSVEKGLEYVSPSVTTILGYTPEELLSDPFLGPSLIMQSDKQVLESYERLIKEGVFTQLIRDFVLTHKDGKQVHMDTSINSVKDDKGGIIAFEGIMRDVTEQKLAEEALKRSERSYRALFESMTDGLIVIDAETLKWGLVNQSALEMFGLNSPEKGLGADAFDFLHPADKDKIFNLDAFGKNMHKTNETRCITKDGGVIWINVGCTISEYQGREVYLASIRDITEQKKAEEALRQSEKKYRQLFENMQEGLWLIDKDSITTFVNPRMAEILGYTMEEMSGKHLFEFMDEHGIEVAKYFLERRRQGTKEHHDFEFIRKDCTRVYANLETSPITDEAGNYMGALACVADITERRKAEEQKQRMEEQLHRAGRLAAVGELAAGIAHELNNPLAAIQMYSESLKRRNDLGEAIQNDLQTIYEQAIRASKITSNLLSFARRHKPEKRLTSINEVIEKTLEIRAHQLEVNNIELLKDLQSDLPLTMADPYDMEQVFMNIIINAEQAMSEAHGRGKLQVQTKSAKGWIEIAFIDDGPGISEEHLKKVFDPFFTTKPVGKGTGLGLSICLGIVQSHDGHVYAMSKPGQGATFVVEIPIVSRGQQPSESGNMDKAGGG